MIIEALCNLLFGLVSIVLSFLPSGMDLPNWGFDFINLIQIAGQFFPLDVLVVILSNVLFWISAKFVWAIVEWIYNKIPGIGG